MPRSNRWMRYFVEAVRTALVLAVIAFAGVEVLGSSDNDDAPPRQLFAVGQIQLIGVSGSSVTVEQIMQQQVYLQPVNGHHTIVEADADATAVTLGELIPDQAEPLMLDADGVRGIAQAVFRAYADRQIVAVRVEIPQDTIANLIEPDGSRVLVIGVAEGRVEQLRTVRRDARGQPIETDIHWYTHVTAHSPVADGDMVQLDEVERYVKWLNRHPGRRVDIAMARGAADDSLALEYIITDHRPFGAYFQLSNTGTDETGKWRQRFGLFHHSLTGADDTLTLDYVTSGFEDVHAFSGSYSRPIPGLNRTRGRIFGSWNQYTASDIGLAGLDLTGEGYSVGGEISTNILQHDELFIDLIAGLRYEHTESLNQAIGQPGRAGFLLPSLNFRADHRSRSTHTSATWGVETNMPGLAHTDSDELMRLGRGNTDRSWWLMRYGVSHSFFLEPIFHPDWSKPDTGSTMAHEIFLSVQGQHVLGNDRLPSSFTSSVGGFYTVRGYPQAFNALDNTLVATAEYRLHIPRLFSPGEPAELFGQPFRWRPERELGNPDWNLMFRAFVDAAHATHNRRLAFEDNADLIGAGVGMEISLKHNLRFRTDFAWALKEANNGANRVTAGSTQIHMELTVSY